MTRTKKLAVVAAATSSLLAASIAWAAWTANGTGEGYAKASSAQALTTVDVASSTSAQLYPGGSGDLVVKIANPNPYPVRVTDIKNKAGGSIVADAGHASCVTTGVSYANQSGTWDVPANGSAQFTLNNVVSMSNASDTGCQGAVFTIPVSLEGHSNAS